MNPIKHYLESLGILNGLKDLNDIKKLIKAHLSTFPFTSISVLLERELSLELQDLVNKIVDRREGGYCFEHNKLIYEALLYYGFDVKPLFARVLNNQNIVSAKTHRSTLLTINNEAYIVDVGFSFLSPSMPIKFGSEPTVSDLGTLYIINKADDDTFLLEIIQEDELYTLYSFDMHNYNEMDFEVGHFYSYKHPKANFVNNLVISRILDDKILSLRNNTYHIIDADAKEEITIKTYLQLKTILESDFDYHVKDDDLKYLYEKFVLV